MKIVFEMVSCYVGELNRSADRNASLLYLSMLPFDPS